MKARTIPEMLGAYAAHDPARFHMPGHKGRGMDGFWRGELPGWDVTALNCTDDLHAPSGAIARTQETLAQAYGAAHAFISVNGSTAAVQAMLLSLAHTDRLLLMRDAHQSAIMGAALAGLETDFIAPVYHAGDDLLGQIDAQALDEALTRTHATAVLLTSPNQYGLCADLDALSKTAHAHGALLLLDAAHGAHFPFSPLLPAGAANCADLWTHAQHETMDALTQAASLFMSDCRIAPERAARALAMTEMASPSYLLMASLDWSVFMARRRDWTGQVRFCRALSGRIGALPGLSVLTDAALPGAEVRAHDDTRLVIDVSGRGLSGQAARLLLEKAGVFIQTADARRLVLITTPSDDPSWYGRLLSALEALPFKRGRARTYRPVPAGARRMGLREAVLAPQRLVPLSEAAGCVAGGLIGLDPPGFVTCMPGEEISCETVEALTEAQACGANMIGLCGGCLSAAEG